MSSQTRPYLNIPEFIQTSATLSGGSPSSSHFTAIPTVSARRHWHRRTTADHSAVEPSRPLSSLAFETRSRDSTAAHRSSSSRCLLASLVQCSSFPALSLGAFSRSFLCGSSLAPFFAYVPIIAS